MSDTASIPRPASAVDQAFASLRSKILYGAWPAGTAVPSERELTETLQVSRSTVREALNRLASAGLIAMPPGATKRVLDWRDHGGVELLGDMVLRPDGTLDLAVIRSATEMRAALAPDIARLAALRRTETQAAQLVFLADSLDDLQDLDALLLRTLDWWTALVHASDNLGYRLAYNTLRSTYTEGREPLRDVIAEELQARELYQHVARAVRGQDPAAAHSHCAELVTIGTHAIYGALLALSSN